MFTYLSACLKTLLSPRFYLQVILSNLNAFVAGLLGILTIDYYNCHRNELEWRTERSIETLWSLGTFGTLLAGLLFFTKATIKPYKRISKLHKSFKK